MSKYLNPRNKPKEVWLFDNGVIVPNPVMMKQFSGISALSLEFHANEIVDDLVLCMLENPPATDPKIAAMTEKEKDDTFFNDYVIVDLVNNGRFRAAAVYTSREEIIETYKGLEGDLRQRIWFVVEKEKALSEVRDM